MAHTCIIRGTVSGSRRGYRRQAEPIFSSDRYRVTEERTSYPDGDRKVDTSTWHENRMNVSMTTKEVETRYTTIELQDGRTVEIDTNHHHMMRGETVHVAVHHILGRQYVDLFHDKRKTFSASDRVQFADPDKRAPLILGLVVAGGSLWFGRDDLFSVTTGAYAGVGLYVFMHVRRTYGEQRIRLMRALTARKLKKTVSNERRLAVG